MQTTASTTQRSEVDAFAAATRDLVGVALRSIAPEGVTTPQFRLLLALHEHDAVPSAQMARTLGLAASSITRLADRLVASGLVRRGGVPEHRGVVTLSLTGAGKELVGRVIHRRHTELSGVLDCLTPQTRAAAAEALRAIHELLGQDESIGQVLL